MPPLSDRFVQAVALAADLHRDQVRKGTEIPYLSHLLAVASLVLEHGGAEDDAIAAILHDAAEDQGGLATLERIRIDFGAPVADMVAAVSDSFEVTKPPWRERKEHYLAHLREADARAVRLSLADKLHNARCTLDDVRNLGPSTWSRFKGGRDGTLWYLRSVVAIARDRHLHPRAADQLAEVTESLAAAG